MADYDLGEAFKAIEEELIASMIRNMDHHRAEETKEGIQWSQWQVEQLNALEEYRRENREKFNPRFRDINAQIPDLIDMARQQGGMDQEASILEAMKQGLRTRKTSDAVMGEFFTVNDRKLNALVNATQNDFSKAEHAVLRMANDKYRKAIFNAQVYANAGGTTYEKAVDMATRDMLRAGLNCVEYKNGARHTLSDYADMCLKTATKRAYLTGEGEKRKEWGISLVIVNKRNAACPKCMKFCGVVLIDDVWSGGEPDGKHQLMSSAIEQGLYHPRCKDIHTTYFPGISTMPDKLSNEEKEEIVDDYNQEQKQNYYQRQAEQQEQMEKYSLDPENKRKHGERKKKYLQASESVQLDAQKMNDNSLENSGKSSTIKSLDIDDFNMMASSNKIKDEVSDVMGNTIKEFEKSGGMYIAEAHFGEFYNEETGKQALFQIYNDTNGLTQLNVNSGILGGKSVDEVNALLAGTKSNLPQTIEEAIAHECGHAKAYYRKSTKEIEAMNEELKNMGIEGISQDALRDGAECIAEVEVLIYRGVEIPKAAMDLYNKYVRGR